MHNRAAPIGRRLSPMARNAWSGQRLPHPPGRRRIFGDIERDADPTTPTQNLLRRCEGLPELVEFKAFRERFVFVMSARLCAQVCDDATFDKALPPAILALRRFSGTHSSRPSPKNQRGRWPTICSRRPSPSRPCAATTTR